MQAQKTSRLIAVTSFAVGDSWNDAGYVGKFFFWLFLGRILADKEVQEQKIKEAEGIDWTIVRPGGLTNSEKSGKYRVGEHISGGRIPRADVAEFVLKEATSSEWKFKTPTIVQ
jgi:hypothetical protein